MPHARISVATPVVPTPLVSLRETKRLGRQTWKALGTLHWCLRHGGGMPFAVVADACEFMWAGWAPAFGVCIQRPALVARQVRLQRPGLHRILIGTQIKNTQIIHTSYTHRLNTYTYKLIYIYISFLGSSDSRNKSCATTRLAT